MEYERVVINASSGMENKLTGYLVPAQKGEACLGTIQIVHGMADHFSRFDRMIQYFTSNGFNVCGVDIMGHGETVALNEGNGIPCGYFGDNPDSAECIIKDVVSMRQKAVSRFGDKPFILLGHSMGSFITRNIISREEYAKGYDAFVLSSTMGKNPAAGAGKLMAKLFVLFGQGKKQGSFLNAISFGSYGKRIDNPRTEFDWLTTDAKAVDAYIADPLAGFTFTNKGFVDLLTLVCFQQSAKAYKSLSSKPILFTYGMDDPVSGFGKGASSVARKMKECGADVTVINYGDNVRHEVHNEPKVENKFYADIISFSKKSIKAI